MLSDILVLYKLVNNLIDCPELVEKVILNVPEKRTRNTCLYYVPICSTNFQLNAPMFRICTEANILQIDLYAASLNRVKSMIMEKITKLYRLLFYVNWLDR